MNQIDNQNKSPNSSEKKKEFQEKLPTLTKTHKTKLVNVSKLQTK